MSHFITDFNKLNFLSNENKNQLMVGILDTNRLEIKHISRQPFRCNEDMNFPLNSTAPNITIIGGFFLANENEEFQPFKHQHIDLSHKYMRMGDVLHLESSLFRYLAPTGIRGTGI